MMLWVTWIELYHAALQEFLFGKEVPDDRPSAPVISLAAERAKRRRQDMRAL